MYRYQRNANIKPTSMAWYINCGLVSRAFTKAIKNRIVAHKSTIPGKAKSSLMNAASHKETCGCGVESSREPH